MCGSARVRLSLTLALLALTACGPTPPGTHGTSGPELGTVTGTLQGARTEGSSPCIWLVAQDGDRVLIAWPDGWTFDAEPAVVADAQGVVIGREGDVLTITGTWSQAGESVCDGGRQLHADEVSRE